VTAPSAYPTATGRPAAAPRGQPAAKPLRIVQGRQRHAPRRLTGRLAFVGVAATVAIAFALVYLHVLLAERQLTLDNLATRVQKEEATYQQLRLQVAELSSPEHIVTVAEGTLGMRQPTSVKFLTPVPTQTAGGSATSVGGAGASGAAASGAAASGAAASGAAVTEPANSPATVVASAQSAPSGEADWPEVKSVLAGSP
jgi:cell division protein FtsL